MPVPVPVLAPVLVLVHLPLMTDASSYLHFSFQSRLDSCHHLCIDLCCYRYLSLPTTYYRCMDACLCTNNSKDKYNVFNSDNSSKSDDNNTSTSSHNSNHITNANSGSNTQSYSEVGQMRGHPDGVCMYRQPPQLPPSQLYAYRRCIW